MQTSSAWILIILAALLAGNVAQADPDSEPLSIVLEAQKVESVADGSERLIEAQRVKPGDVVEYSATYANIGGDPIDGLLGTLPIPPGTSYLPGSEAPVEVTASIDGVRFEAPPLKRERALPDGSTEVVEIPVAEYRYLRWSFEQLPPGEQRVVRARVQVKR